MTTELNDATLAFLESLKKREDVQGVVLFGSQATEQSVR